MTKREADSARRAIERVGGVAVAADLETLLGISRARVAQLRATQGFPAPFTQTVGDRPLWAVADVLAWDAGRSHRPGPVASK